MVATRTGARYRPSTAQEDTINAFFAVTIAAVIATAGSYLLPRGKVPFLAVACALHAVILSAIRPHIIRHDRHKVIDEVSKLGITASVACCILIMMWQAQPILQSSGNPPISFSLVALWGLLWGFYKWRAVLQEKYGTLKPTR